MKTTPLILKSLIVGLPLAVAMGCIHVKTDPIEVKPIYITADINIKIRNELDDFYKDVDKAAATQPAASSVTPAAK